MVTTVDAGAHAVAGDDVVRAGRERREVVLPDGSMVPPPLSITLQPVAPVATNVMSRPMGTT